MIPLMVLDNKKDLALGEALGEVEALSVHL